MALELSPAQHAALAETKALDTPQQFQNLLAAAKPTLDAIVDDVLLPNQPISTTVTELRDLYLATTQYASELATASYDASRRAHFRDAIRLAVTADAWFSEGNRTGAYRVRTIDETIQASRPWRARLRAYGEHAFALSPKLSSQFADVNSTGTIVEEEQDLMDLLALVTEHKDELAAVGMSDAFVAEGQSLYDEACGRNLLGILGLRNKEEAIVLRNQILTYATALGREARAAGVNACYGDDIARRRFEAASFRLALRRLVPKRKNGGAIGAGETGDAAEDEIAAPIEEPAAPPA